MTLTNWQYRLLAFVLSLFCWYLVTGREKVETWIQIPVEMTKAPSGLVIRGGLVNKIDVRIRGPKGLVRGFDPKGIAYTLNLSELHFGSNVMPIDPENIPVTKAIEIVEVKPARLDLSVDKEMTSTVPVKVQWKADVDPEYQIERIVVEPDSVRLTGPATLVSKISSAVTQLMMVPDGVTEIWEGQAGLNLPSEVESSSGVVRVRFELAAKKVQGRFKVQVEPPYLAGHEIRVYPGNVDLIIEGPAPEVKQKNFRDRIKVRAVLPENLGKGKHRLAFRVEMPTNCILVRSEPDTLDVTVREVAK